MLSVLLTFLFVSLLSTTKSFRLTSSRAFSCTIYYLSTKETAARSHHSLKGTLKGTTALRASGEEDSEDDEEENGVFKISIPKNDLINFSPPSKRSPSPLSSQLVIVGGTTGLLLGLVYLFVWINKDLTPPPY